MTGSIRESLAKRHVEDPLTRGEGPRLSTELPDQELGPCEGLQRELGGSLCNTPGVCHQLNSGFELKHDRLSDD
jgi:hypothetical protein